MGQARRKPSSKRGWELSEKIRMIFEQSKGRMAAPASLKNYTAKDRCLILCLVWRVKLAFRATGELWTKKE